MACVLGAMLACTGSFWIGKIQGLAAHRPQQENQIAGGKKKIGGKEKKGFVVWFILIYCRKVLKEIPLLSFQYNAELFNN